MATQVEPKELNIQAQIASIDEALANAARQRAESDRTKIDVERIRAEIRQREEDTRLSNRNSIFQAMIATAALLGAGAALAKLFFP